jgi:hypothetical protein
VQSSDWRLSLVASRLFLLGPMAHLKENIEYPPHTNPFFQRASCGIDPQLQENLAGAGREGVDRTMQQFGNPPVVNHGDGEV